MKYYNSFYVGGLEEKEVSHLFMRAILAYSDAFSLVYFRYSEEEFLESVTEVQKELSPFKLESRFVDEWPGTKTTNNNRHSYNMITYRVDMDVLPVLERANTLWDWDYPKYPMDPCFYRSGYAWFAVSAHERWNELYMMDDGSFPLVNDLECLGVSLTYRNTISEDKLYYNPYCF